MDQISELIKSPVFWFASVFIAFLINLFSGFAKDWIQNILALRSIRKRNDLKEKNEKLIKKISVLKKDHQLLAVYQSNIVYQKLRQVLYLVVQYMAFLFAVSNIVNGSEITALVFMLLFFIFHVTATNPISKRISEMRHVLNGALENEDYFFSG